MESWRQVYSLPGLEEVQVRSLEDVLGFPWSWDPDIYHMPPLQTSTAVSSSGQVSCLSPATTLFLSPTLPLAGIRPFIILLAIGSLEQFVEEL